MIALMLTPDNNIYKLNRTEKEVWDSFVFMCANYYLPWDRHLEIWFEDDLDENFEYDPLLNNNFGVNELARALRPRFSKANYYTYVYVVRVDDKGKMIDLTDYDIEAIHTFLFESGKKFTTNVLEYDYDTFETQGF